MSKQNNRWNNLTSLLPSTEFSVDVIWNVISLFILAIGGFIVNALILFFEDESTLGVFNQVFAVYTVVSQIGVGGVQYSVLKSISHNQDDLTECLNQALSGLLMVFLITLPLSIGTWLLAGSVGRFLDSPNTAIGIQLIAPGLIFFTMNKVLINITNGLAWMKAYAVFRSLRYGLIPIFVIGLFSAGLGGAYLTLSLTLTEIVLFFALSIFIFKRFSPLRWPKEFGSYLSNHISFGIRGMFSGILMSLNNKIDVLMLGYFTSDARVGIYSFAVNLADGASQLPIALRVNIDPILGRLFSEKKTAEIEDLSKRIRRIFFPIMVGISLIAMAVYPLLIKVIAPGTDLRVSWIIFCTVMIGVMINASYRPMKGIFLQAGKPIIHTMIVVGLVLGDALMNLIVIPRYEIFGAAAVTSMTYIIEAILIYTIARKIFSLRL